MAKKNIIEKKPEQWEVSICDDCTFAKWVKESTNLDHAGNPICFTCIHKKFYTIRGTKACDKFVILNKASNE